MGNIGSTNVNGRRRTMNGHTHSNHHHHHHHHHPPPSPPPSQPPQPELTANRYVFAAATPYPPPPQYPNPTINAHLPYYQYAGYFQPPPTTAPPLPSPYAHLHHHPNWINNRYPSPPPVIQPPPPYVEHQKAVTIRNDVNLKKETLKIIPDDENPGKFLVTFTFDATVPGCITIIYFAKEDQNCTLTPTKQTLQTPIKVNFEKGLGQKYKQPSGTGIDLSKFNQSELSKESETGIYPLAVKAEASPENTRYGGGGGGVNNCQITQAVFEKVKGEDIVKVMKQILWVNGMRYELQEIYGIGNSVDGDFDGNDAGKECVICLSEPRDTTVLPCRHMCMCSGCAKVLRFQTNRCPICRQPVERLLEIRVNNTIEE